jgi:hypothetical protein
VDRLDLVGRLDRMDQLDLGLDRTYLVDRRYRPYLGHLADHLDLVDLVGRIDQLGRRSRLDQLGQMDRLHLGSLVDLVDRTYQRNRRYLGA